MKTNYKDLDLAKRIGQSLRIGTKTPSTKLTIEKEWDLSSKVIGALTMDGRSICKRACNVIDVKEFIRRLKADLKEANWNIEDIWEMDKPSAQEMVDKLIDKLAGEELI